MEGLLASPFQSHNIFKIDQARSRGGNSFEAICFDRYIFQVLTILQKITFFVLGSEAFAIKHDNIVALLRVCKKPVSLTMELCELDL